MFEFGVPALPLPLTMFTSTLMIQGDFRTRIMRLTDVLNEPDNASMVLTGVTVRNVATGRELGRLAVMKVQMGQVLMVHTTVPTEGSGQLRTAKQPMDARIFLPPFTVEGTIHLVYESELRAAIGSLMDRWLPITSPRYWTPASVDNPTSVDLLVINHAHAQIAIIDDSGWGAAPAAHSDAGQNPW